MPFSPYYEEEGFLKQLGLEVPDLEPLASNCTQVLVWHTRTRKPEGDDLPAGVKKSDSGVNVAKLRKYHDDVWKSINGRYK